MNAKQNEFQTTLKAYISEHYPTSPKCFIRSFGCAQNVSDGEKLAGMLKTVGYEFTDELERADLIIYNTCAVRENAEDRVFGQIGELKRLKEANPSLVIGICGCMAQESKTAERICETYKQIDLVFGTYSYTQLFEMLFKVLTDHRRIFNQTENGEDLSFEYQLREDKVHASVPIMYGCNNFCTYCIVPYVRGRERSREPSEIIGEVSRLVSDGYKEITLLGQNVNSYSYGFPQLLRKLNELDGDFRIRFMSSHPKDAGRELIDAIFECDKVCKHLHLPVQAGNNRVLFEMNRKYTIEDYLRIVDYARSKDEGFSFSSDIIVGFPGETYEEFCDTKKLLARVEFDNVFTFVYSKRTGTKSAEMTDNISEKEKGLWLRELVLFQREIAVKRLSRFVDKTVRVLVDGEGKENGFLTGRNDENIIVEFEGDKELIGRFCDIKITKAMNWALLGEIV